ncbi:MAG: tRNA preQ1(34) S-adenosylmethionine ribosyltransferase-isomerase QueA [Gammaproteobacteria bacterium]|nr:MAG: tRNA preQ1(34) S-adenosylmethionine ribosyltransferase-isomerase QueA [Gammaproteobacteria bacterium]
MKLSDFNFPLPSELIARYPLTKRSSSRLLCMGRNGVIIHRQFHEIIDLIEPGDLLVFNDTKVIPARLFGQKMTGGQAEVLVERILDDQRILAQVRVSKSPHTGDELLFPQGIRLEVIQRREPFYELRYPHTDRTILQVIESIGHIPLPPYMRRSAEESDYERYQTVYAKQKGSVAAPTAGLHFDEELLERLCDKNIEIGCLTLHIGAGTFAPVRVEDIRDHKMHSEYLEVSEELCEKINFTKARGKRVIAVGTTSLRALETASQSGCIEPYHGETNIFIYPGYRFRCVDALVTNLHLPCSTLLMLVCAFGGYAHVMRAYREAVAQSYRFYSYGDAMWVTLGV